ncbi:alginate export family protein [Erythrobacter sp. LQ02-29]|uniref:alginate export family protein n=1 Tax=Erythrobacter sp. LQ02-29 TaxID=2920384 RepID=UPI001F4DE5CE|nr:alginate export family protein [Erythrobacter sp. LQ02-29]MCP9222365.1 alginate export family protein [Erythrobacter sp. LQ02-29]
MTYRLCLVSALALASTPALAQNAPAGDTAWTLQDAIGDPDNLEVSGSARVRYEALHNQFRPALDRNDDLVTLRFTLAARYDAGPVEVGAELQDSRAYFGDTGSSVGTGEVNAVELIQAYLAADLGQPFGAGSEARLTAGRFTMDLGSRRLVGRNNFRNATNAFTGVRFDAKGSGGKLTAFVTMPQQRLPSDKASILDNEVEWDHEGTDLLFWGAFGSFSKLLGGADLEAYFYGLDEDDRPGVATRDRRLYTPGFRLVRAPAKGQADCELEYAHQFGSISDSTAVNAPRRDVSANFAHAALGYRFAAKWQPRVALEYDFASGDGSGRDYGRFDSLYGPRRSDFGPTGIYGPLGRSNIHAPGVRLEAAPSRLLDGFVSYRALWLDSASDSFANTGVRDPSGRAGRFAGHQVEGRVRYWFVKDLLRLDTGAAVLFDGPFLRDAPNAPRSGDTLYGYVDLTATF